MMLPLCLYPFWSKKKQPCYHEPISQVHYNHKIIKSAELTYFQQESEYGSDGLSGPAKPSLLSQKISESQPDVNYILSMNTFLIILTGLSAYI